MTESISEKQETRRKSFEKAGNRIPFRVHSPTPSNYLILYPEGLSPQLKKLHCVNTLGRVLFVTDKAI